MRTVYRYQVLTCLCFATGCASPWYTREECLAIVKSKGVDLELSEPQILAERVRNPMFLVGSWWGEMDITMTFVMPHMEGHISQMRLSQLCDFRADGTYSCVVVMPEDETGTNIMLDKHRVFGTWKMDGEVLVLKETNLYDGKIHYRDLERRLTVLRYGSDEVGLQATSIKDMKNEQVEANRQLRLNDQFAAQFGTPLTNVGYDCSNRRVECTFTPYKDNKGMMSVTVSSNPRYVRTAKPSMPLANNTSVADPSPFHTLVVDSALRQIGHRANPRYALERFQWEATMRCGFEYRIDGECTLSMLSEIEREVCAYIRNSYLSAHLMADARSVEVDARLSFDNGRVVGTGEVLAITLVDMKYDAASRRGKVSVKFNAGQYEMVRVWVRRNIETLARNKNIVLKTGETPPPGSYISGDERVVDTPVGKVLEMEFKTE